MINLDRRECYRKLRTIFKNESTRDLKFIKEKTEIKEDLLNIFLNDNVLYILSEDKKTVSKKEKLEFKMIKITTEKVNEVETMELK